jgi:hypothetical protein
MEITWILQTVTALIVGVIGFFVKSTLSELKDGIKKSDEKVKAVEVKLDGDIKSLKDELNDLKSDLPFVYVLREDFIRSLNNVDSKMNNIDNKIDKLLQYSSKGKEDR